MQRWERWWRVPAGLLPVILVALTGALYGNSLLNGFTIDDPFTYADNPSIRDVRNMRYGFDPTYFTISREASYRPVCTATYFLDWALWQERALGPHLTNVGLYAAMVAMLFLCFSRAVPASRWGPFLGAVLFAIHPLHSEVVNNISFREDLLVGLFLAGAWWFHLRRRDAGRVWLGDAAAALLFLLALFSKESAVVFPVMMVVADGVLGRWQGTPVRGRRGLLMAYGLLTACAAVFCFVRFYAMAYRGVGSGAEAFAPAALLLSNVKIQAWYLVLWVMPFDLRSYYTVSAYPPVLDGAFIAGLALLAALAAALVVFRRRRTFVLGWLWWGIAMAPVANFYPLFQPMAERYTFWPSVGPCLWVGVCLAGGLQGRRRWPLAALALLVLTTLSVTVVRRNRVWRDEATVWKTLAARAPDDAMIEVHLATAAYASGDYAVALRHGERTLALVASGRGKASPAVVHLVLGGARFALGDLSGALAEFRVAENHLPARPDIDVAVYRNLGLTYDRLNDLPAAAAAFARATELDPRDDELWSKLAFCQLRRGERAAAEAAWNRARRLKADLPEFAVLERAYEESLGPATSH